MSSPVPVAPTTKGKSQLSSQTLLQVNKSATATPEWETVFGLSAFTYSPTPNLVDNTDYDSVDEDGTLWTGQAVASRSWSCSATLTDKDYGTASYVQDPGQKFLEDNDGQLVQVRWFDRQGNRDGREGSAWVGFSRGDNSGLSTVSLTLTGDGKPAKIDNPLATP